MTTVDFEAMVVSSVSKIAADKSVSVEAMGRALVNRGGVSRQMMAKILSGEKGARLTTADLFDLVAKLGPELLQEIAHRRGLSLSVKHAAPAVVSASAMMHVATAQKEFADASMVAARALEDGHVSHSEAAEMRREYREAAMACDSASMALGQVAI